MAAWPAPLNDTLIASEGPVWQVSASEPARLLPKPGAGSLAARDLPSFFSRPNWVGNRRPTEHVGGDSARLFQDTHRLATNAAPDRRDDSGRVSREAMRFGHSTNHSDADDHVSTMRLSRGQSQRVSTASRPSLIEPVSRNRAGLFSGAPRPTVAALWWSVRRLCENERQKKHSPARPMSDRPDCFQFCSDQAFARLSARRLCHVG